MHSIDREIMTEIKFDVDELKELIEDARSQGLGNVADFWAEELRTILAMKKFDDGEL